MAHPTQHPQTRWWLLLLGLSLVGGLMVRGLNLTNLNTTAVVYWGLPWLVAVIITLTAPPGADGQPRAKISVMRGSIIAMLGSSFLIGEGFICVLMFLPIYALVVALVLATNAAVERRARALSKRHPIHLTPLLLALLALEGTHPNLSFDREASVTVQEITALDRQKLWANLHKPMTLNRTASSGLSKLFPQPIQIDIDSFEPGAVHTVHYRYARWLWTNVHEGTLTLRVEEATNNTISARVIDNTSYLANYLDLKRLSLTITDQPEGTREVAIRIDYRRTLDPAWYFSPLIELALEGSGAHLINTHVLREG